MQPVRIYFISYLGVQEVLSSCTLVLTCCSLLDKLGISSMQSWHIHSCSHFFFIVSFSVQWLILHTRVISYSDLVEAELSSVLTRSVGVSARKEVYANFICQNSSVTGIRKAELERFYHGSLYHACLKIDAVLHSGNNAFWSTRIFRLITTTCSPYGVMIL